MLVLAYVAVSISILNVLVVTGIIAIATRNWHPIKSLLRRDR